MSAHRYPWQAFTSHKMRRVSFQNRAHWHHVNATELDRVRRAVGDCSCLDCRVLLDQVERIDPAPTLPGFDL